MVKTTHVVSYFCSASLGGKTDFAIANFGKTSLEFAWSIFTLSKMEPYQHKIEDILGESALFYTIDLLICTKSKSDTRLRYLKLLNFPLIFCNIFPIIVHNIPRPYLLSKYFFDFYDSS